MVKRESSLEEAIVELFQRHGLTLDTGALTADLAERLMGSWTAMLDVALPRHYTAEQIAEATATATLAACQAFVAGPDTPQGGSE